MVQQELNQDKMALTEQSQQNGAEQQPTKEQLIEALQSFLKKKDREEICKDYKISRPTYYRIVRELDLSHEAMPEMLKRANAEKKRQEDARRSLTNLV
ncbi:hypothetical protein BXP70_25300 [Hymenobacter crusticola]|uniref:Uncharacterized protein n=2 Tax=Hymenobacter crusticola TaxID=1770526 RepID=A0A2C9ZTY4_9BACT|nr:hypothetical protein BXP70_25300 [Hymenobacter crusticola]